MMSMTAYASLEKNIKDYKIFCEIKSLNNRYLDIYIDIPYYLNSLDNELRKLVSSKVKRGKVKLSLSLQRDDNNYIDKELLRQYVNTVKGLCEEYNLEYNIKTSDLVMMINSLKPSRKVDDKDILNTIEPIILEVIDNIVKDKKREGTATKNNLIGLISEINRYIKEIKDFVPLNKEKSITKMKTNINEYIKGIKQIDDERLLPEVAILLSKIDINEELERLSYHIKEFSEILSITSSTPIGKKLEFLSQEILREINTIASKSNDINISSLSVSMKSTLEQIKEQIRNIE